MPDTPAAHTEDLANTEYDAGHRARAAAAKGETSKPLPVPSEDPGVGLTQKGTDEEAIVRRETEI